MPSLFDSIGDLLGQGDTLSTLGGAIEADGATANQAARSAVPVLLSGLADRAKESGGPDAVMAMLDSVDNASAGNGSPLQGDTKLGAGLLDGIFGANLAGVMNNLAGSTGLNMGSVARLMPMLAPMVMKVLSSRRHADGLGGSGVANLLIGEQAAMERDGLLSGLGGLSGTASSGVDKIGGIAAGGIAAGGMAAGGAAGLAGAAAGGVGKLGGIASDGVSKVTGAGVNSVGKIGGAASDGVGKVTGAASNGVGTVTGAASNGVGRVTGAASDGVGKVTGAASGGAAKLGGAAAGGAGAIGGAMKSPGSPGGRFGKLGWILGAVVAVLLAAWALSQCGGSDVVDTVESTAGDAVDAVEETVEEGVEVLEETADTVVETVEEVTDAVEEAIDFQPGIDDAVTATGVAGVAGAIDGDGVVTLTGEVDSASAKQAVEQAVLGADGVTSVNNEITVVEAEQAAPAAGSTINDILDLDPITFAVNSAEITAEGQAVLANAVEFMTTNPEVAVEIGGHTDSDGSDATNEALSQSRADSVKAFLEANGVDGDRMTTKGYGESVPKVANDTPENKAINRRIEFTIQ